MINDHGPDAFKINPYSSPKTSPPSVLWWSVGGTDRH